MFQKTIVPKGKPVYLLCYTGQRSGLCQKGESGCCGNGKAYCGTGQVAESSRVDNYLGFTGINGYDLGEKFREHAISLGVEFKDGEAVQFTTEDEIWKVKLKNGEVLEQGQ